MEGQENHKISNGIGCKQGFDWFEFHVSHQIHMSNSLQINMSSFLLLFAESVWVYVHKSEVVSWSPMRLVRISDTFLQHKFIKYVHDNDLCWVDRTS